MKTAALILTFGLLATPLPAGAQQGAKAPRIGLLSTLAATEAAKRASSQTLQQELSKLGVIEYRYAEGRLELLPDLAAELVRLKVDVIVASSAAAGQAAKRATSTIPIVVIGISDPVRVGLASSYARPGGNLTAVANLAYDIVVKQLELIKEAVPSVTRIAVLGPPRDPVHGHDVLRNDMIAAAKALGVTLQFAEVKVRSDLEPALVAITKERAEAVLVLPDPISSAQRNRIADFALKRQLPTIAGFREYVEAGCLMSYGASFVQQAQRVAVYVAKILHGAKPGDLPIEQSMKFDLVINMRTAKALGLTVPPTLLLRADHVID